MIKWQEALEVILGAIRPLGAARIPIDKVFGLVAAEDVMATENLPPFSNSAMDGFAVSHSDCEGASESSPISLSVIEDLPAGSVASQDLPKGAAMRIMTGAMMPRGSDSVVPVEDTRSSGSTVEILKAPKPNGNVRAKGEDVKDGQRAILAFDVINAAAIGLLAALGIERISAIPPAKVGIITTGGELVDISKRPGPGQIRDSNMHSLSALVSCWGAWPIHFPRIADSPDKVAAAIRRAADMCDVIVTTGGVSVGDYDCVKGALADIGAKQHFWRVAQRPGGPFGFWDYEGRPVFGLPGNPVSAMVMAELYLRPALAKMMGRMMGGPGNGTHWQRRVKAKFVEGFRKSGMDGKRHFIRVVAQEKGSGWEANLSGPQGSAQLFPMKAANALAMVPEDVAEIPKGGVVELLLFD
ncbi:MAG: molybdopterin molybdotransferase MoeA [Holophagales bacterium]|jgi:molybdopterin molybdotransferase|nr:molybdopterin molybdotransferase MoeA [Holophagales bacterium]